MKNSSAKIGDYLTLQRGFDITKAEQELGFVPVVSSSGVNSYHSKSKVEGPGVVIGRKGTLGTAFYLENDFWPHDTSLWVKDFKGNHSRFVYYFLKSLPLERLDSGSANPTLNRNVVHLIDAAFPGYNEQVRISNVISNLDSKISLNNRINKELEAMAKLIYDYWFVQFDFPNENGKPYKSSGGKMVYNEEVKREIPVGWEVGTLSRWIDKDKTGDWGKESEQGNYSLKVSCIRGADIRGLNGKGEVKAPTRFVLKKNSGKLLNEGDIIIEISGGSPTQSTGRMAFITEETLNRFDDPIICSNFCKAISLSNPNSIYNFVYEWNRLYAAGVLFGWEGKTSGIKNFLFDSFVTKHELPTPPNYLMEKFREKAEPIHSMIQKNLQQNKKLSELRDWLLPMLMNGQVTVKEAEEYVQKEGLSMAAEEGDGYGNS